MGRQAVMVEILQISQDFQYIIFTNKNTTFSNITYIRKPPHTKCIGDPKLTKYFTFFSISDINDW